MSEPEKTDPTTKPAPTQAPQEQLPSPPASPTQGSPPPSGPPQRPGKQRFDRPRGREPGPRRVPALEPERDFGPKPSLRELDKELESELEAALSGFSAKELVDEPGQRSQQPAEPGRKMGKVIAVHGADVFVDVPGGRGQGLLPLDQFPEGPPAPGTEVEIGIEGYDRANGLTLLSRRGSSIAMHADWSSVAEGMVVEARVLETNKGGLTVNINGIRGFMPISQIDLYRVEQADQYVNQKLLCLVVEVNQAEHNLIVSRRALLEKEREEQREKIWTQLAEGQVYEGVVRSVRKFGAFIDLGGVDGLLHVSEMSWARVQDPTTVVQQGQTVKVVVLKIDREKRKLSLGMKQLLASPWDEIDAKFPINGVVPGKVTKLMEFGAFVELEPGVEGLVHISELAPRRVFRVSDIVKPGQEVSVAVLRIDREQRKISLSLKAAIPKETPKADEEEEVEEEVKPPKPRTTPLRGGIGGNFTQIPAGGAEGAEAEPGA